MTNTPKNFFNWLRENYDELFGKPADLSQFDSRFFDESVASKSEFDRSHTGIDFGENLVTDCSECRKLSLVSSEKCPGCGNPLTTDNVSDKIEKIEKEGEIIFPESDLSLQSQSQTESEVDDDESGDSSSDLSIWKANSDLLLSLGCAVVVSLISIFVIMIFKVVN